MRGLMEDVKVEPSPTGTEVHMHRPLWRQITR